MSDRPSLANTLLIVAPVAAFSGSQLGTSAVESLLYAVGIVAAGAATYLLVARIVDARSDSRSRRS